MTKRFEFKDIKDLKQVLEFISNRFKKLRLDAKEASRAELVCEESLIKLIGRAAVTSSIFIYVNVRKFLGDVRVELKVPGDEISNFNQELSFEFEDDELKNAEDAIRDIILRSFSSNISYKHRGKFNHVRITAMRSPYSEAYRILASLVLAVLTGLIIRNFMTPENFAQKKFKKSINFSRRSTKPVSASPCSIVSLFL